METKRVIFLTAMLVCFLIFLSGLPEALAGGRPVEPLHDLSGSILFTAWYRDNLINVALCNISDSQHSLKIATGTYDVGKHIYASQSLEIPPNSIKLVYFPILKRQTPRGDLKTSDYVFVFSEDRTSRGLIYFTQIQNMYTRYPKASLDSFIVASGDTARFSYITEYDISLRIILVAKSIKIRNDHIIIGEPAKETLKPASKEDIKKLELPTFYEKKFIKQLEENYCYVIEPGEGATITVVYDIDEIKDCALVTVPVSRHIIKPPGGGGSGHGLTFMIYNPNVVQIKTLLRLSTESEKSKYRTKE
jgi:hypothetical protein